MRSTREMDLTTILRDAEEGPWAPCCSGPEELRRVIRVLVADDETPGRTQRETRPAAR